MSNKGSTSCLLVLAVPIIPPPPYRQCPPDVFLYLPGEKPYQCKVTGCNRRFARISDLRSHERTHDVNSRAFVCTYPGCNKRFTRPYDLKKHLQNLHQDPFRACQVGGRGALTASVPNKGVKRKMAEAAPLNTPPTMSTGVVESLVYHDGEEDNHDNHDKKEQFQGETKQESSRPREVGEGQKQETQQKSSGSRVVEGAITTTLQALSHPSPRRPPATKVHIPYRRVRCDVHKHHDSVEDAVISLEKKRGIVAEASRGDGTKQTGSEDKCEENIHVHGSDCGHAPVLHEGHVDFLLGRGQLDCHEHREVKLSCVLFVCPSPCFATCVRSFVCGYPGIDATPCLNRLKPKIE